MVNESYELKHSRLAIVFQLCLMICMSLVLYFVISLGVWLISMILILVILLWFNQKPKLIRLEQLDQAEWSLKFERQSNITQVSLSHCIDHQFYIVLYFSDKKIKNSVIWQDQLNLMDWKKLKIRAKLN